MEGNADYPKPSTGSHVLLLSWPVQGHINPMLSFSKRLASKGLKVTLITTSSADLGCSSQTTSNFNFLTIFDGFRKRDEANDMEAYVQRFKSSTSQSLFELLGHYKDNQTNLHPTPIMVVYDSVMPWVLDVTRKYGLKAAAFFTQSCVVNFVYYQVHEGALKWPTSEFVVSLPFIKESLRYDDLPTFVSSPDTDKAVVKLVINQYSNFKEADYLFINTVKSMETQVLSWMSRQGNFKTIGPAIPSMYLDKRLLHDKEYDISLFKTETNSCIQWLDDKESGSVVYVSMGSIASLRQEQMEELAIGLENCNKYFLWVVRDSEENKLPFNFKAKTKDKGLIVNWCPQLEVLAHRSLGCFLTHCGWNSTLESICLGVPMVAFPQRADQPTNAKCITDFWRVGIRVNVNEKGIVTRKEIESCIKEVIEGEHAEDFKSNSTKWKQLAKEAMEEGGSSDKNIEDFVERVLRA